MASRRLRAFKRWMKSQGIECCDAIKLSNSPAQGVCVKALYDLKVGGVVAKIPKSACLTIKTSGAREMIESGCLDGCLGLSVAVMYERSLGEASPWAGYLQLLPHQECLPLVWSLDEVDSLLCGTELHKVIKEDKLFVYQDRKESILPLIESPGLKLDHDFFSVEQYFAAKSLISSRSFEIDDYHGFGMVPLADLFNHKTGAEDVHFTSVPSCSESENEGLDDDINVHEDILDNDSQDQSSFLAEQLLDEATKGTAENGNDEECSSGLGGDTSILEMVMVKDVEGGAEVFNTYGSLGNAALLHRYGFTEPNNPYDIVNIDLDLVLQWSSTTFSSRYSRARLSLWRRLGYSGCVSQNSEYFEISLDGKPQIELLILLYVVLLQEDRYHKLDLGSSTANSKGGCTGMILWEKHGMMLDQTLLTKDVCGALLALAQERESFYGRSSLTDDVEALKNCCCISERKQYHSLVLRVSERKILGKLKSYAKRGMLSSRTAKGFYRTKRLRRA